MSSYIQLFSEGKFDDNKYKDCGSLEALFTALAKFHDNFEFIDDGGLIDVPEKNTTNHKCWSFFIVDISMINLLKSLIRDKNRQETYK